MARKFDDYDAILCRGAKKEVVTPLQVALGNEVPYSKLVSKKGKLKGLKKKSTKLGKKEDRKKTSSVSALKKLLDSMINSGEITPVKYQTINKTVITNNIFLNDPGNENSTNGVTMTKTVEITTVVEKIREKNKINSEQTTDNGKHKIRSKRSVNEPVFNSTNDESLKDSKPASQPDGFYRHPKLTYEDQRKNLRNEETTTEKTATSSETLETMNFTNPEFKIVVPSTGSEERVREERGSSETTDSGILYNEESKGNDKAPNFFKNLTDTPSTLTDQRLTASSSESISTDIINPEIEPQENTSDGYEVVEPSDAVSLGAGDRREPESTTSPVPVYDSANIPYVEVPDYSDVREESLDKGNYESVDDVDSDAVDPDDGNENSETIHAYLQNNENEESSVPSSTIETEKEETGTASSDGAPANDSRESERHGNKQGRDGAKEGEDKPEDAIVYEPVTFDINEYTKPFNLEEFMKNDPIFKKLPSFGNPVKSESKNIPYHGDTVEENDSGETENGSKVWLNPGSVLSDSRIESEKHQKEKTSPSARFGDESEFLSRYFTKDVIRKLQEDEENRRNERKREGKGEEVYETLSAILDKKDRISRLNDEIARSAEDEEPRSYKNFWFLEYSSPRRGNKEERKEEQ